MEKKFYFLLASICLASLSYGQIRIALVGGPHSASVKETNSLPLWESQVKPGYSAKPGLHLGLMGEIPLSASSTSGFFLQPGILYMAKGRRFAMSNDTAQSILTDTISASHELSVNYIEIPLNLTYKIPLSKKVRFLVSAGPYAGFFYSGKQNFETRFYSTNSYREEKLNIESGKTEGKVSTFDAGINGRAGFEIGNIQLTGFMSQGLTNFYHAPYDGTFKHRVVGASLSIWLNKAKSPEKTIVDSDNDGVEDLADACPTKAGPALTHGCPDTDDDGIADDKDKCPDIPGLAKYNGCPPPDSDGDGINDEADACPDKPGIPEFNGCPIPDSDGDGLNDQEDKCPTEAGPADNKGCPVVQDTVHAVIEELKLIAGNILFEPNSDRLTASSGRPLTEAATLLQSHPQYRLLIEGHTDSTGSPQLNQALSQKRAESVKNYLIRQGIDASRLEAKGYGSQVPLESNATPEGRAKNRRVELKLLR